MAVSGSDYGTDLRSLKCNRELVRTYLPDLPIVRWLPKYSLLDLQSDITAGLAVGLMVVPQALAYSGIAGLPNEYGLYSSFMGCFVYTFLGSSKDITLGPTAIMSLMTDSVANPKLYGVSYAVALTLICGLVQFAMSLFHLGAIMSFISAPVINGFTSAAAITIAMGQVKHLFGVSRHIRRPFLQNVEDTFPAIFKGDLKVGDIILGFICIALVLSLKRLKKHVSKWDSPHEELSSRVRVSRKILWLVTTGRNALIVLVAAMIGACLKSQNQDNRLTFVKPLPEGLPPVSLPSLETSCQLDDTFHDSGSCKNINHTGIGQLLDDYSVGVITVPLIGLLESVAIAQAFARQNNYRVNPNQELFALGVANIISSFFSSYPVTGSFSRTAVNAQSGVRTPAAGLVTGAVVLLALGVLTPAFKYIPQTALAAIIISAVLTMVDIRILQRLWRVKGIDLLPLAVSFFGTLFLGIEYGVALAVVVNVLYLLYLQARPHSSWKLVGDALVLRPHSGLNFPSVSFLRRRVEELRLELSEQGHALSSVILDLTCVMDVDFAVALTLQDILEELRRAKIVLLCACAEPPVRKVLEAGTSIHQFETVREAIGSGHINATDSMSFSRPDASQGDSLVNFAMFPSLTCAHFS